MQHHAVLMPHARQEGLRVQQLPDEVLVYDLERHRAHCLNKTAALVWRYCDGRTSVADVAGILQQEYHLSATEELVWLALDRLGRAHLLRDLPRAAAVLPRASRRQFVRHLGLTGGASLVLPIVSSIVAPEAVHAVSCVLATQCRSVPHFTPCHHGNTKGCTQKRCCKGLCVSVNAVLCDKEDPRDDD